MKLKKFTVNTPISHCDQVRKAIGEAGAGKIGDYSYCSFSIRGVGRSLPLGGSNPHIGVVGEFEAIEEEQIESFCLPEDFKSVIAAIKKVHPYEEPAISAWDIEIF